MNPIELHNDYIEVHNDYFAFDRNFVFNNYIEQGYELLTKEEYELLFKEGYAIEKENIKHVVHISLVDLVLIKRKYENKI
jgi:hypothetical protein